MKGSGPEQFNADPDLAKISAFSFPWTPVWLGIQAIMTSLSFIQYIQVSVLDFYNIILDYQNCWLAIH